MLKDDEKTGKARPKSKSWPRTATLILALLAVVSFAALIYQTNNLHQVGLTNHNLCKNLTKEKQEKAFLQTETESLKNEVQTLKGKVNSFLEIMGLIPIFDAYMHLESADIITLGPEKEIFSSKAKFIKINNPYYLGEQNYLLVFKGNIYLADLNIKGVIHLYKVEFIQGQGIILVYSTEETNNQIKVVTDQDVVRLLPPDINTMSEINMAIKEFYTALKEVKTTKGK
jgi:hypothetical protein